MNKNLGNSPTMLRGLPLLLLLLALLLIALKTWISPKKMSTINNNVERYREQLVLLGFDPAFTYILISQAAHETANFTSNVFLSNSNMFGMRYPTKRKTTALQELNGYAYYTSIEEGLKDIRLYFDYAALKTNYKTIAEYCEALKNKKYFEALLTEYINGMNFFYSMYYADGK
jgi:uncharacterized FlgJ-related protein